MYNKIGINNEIPLICFYFKKFKIKYIICLIFVIYFLTTYNIDELFISYKEDSPQLFYIGEKSYLKKETTDKFNNYIKICHSGKLVDNKTYNLSSSPKITAIMPIYNGGKYLYYSLRSIQNQKMKDIEIILINDCSTDDSLKIIEKYMKEDPRIRLINNQKNRRILYSKSMATLYSNGKYIVQLDQDDMFISDDAFDYIYNEAEKNNLDLVQFRDFILEEEFHFKKRMPANSTEPNYYYITPHENTYLTQPEIKNNYFGEYNFLLWGLLIKSDIYKKAINILWPIIINYKIIHFEDYTITFIIATLVEKFKYLNSFFIVHLFHKNSVTFNDSYQGQFFSSILLFINFMYEYHLKYNKSDINMLLNLFDNNKYFIANLKKFPELFTFVFRKIINCLKDEEKEIFKKKYDELYNFKTFNTYEYFMGNKQYESILYFQELINSKTKKNIINIDVAPRFSIIVYCNEYKFLQNTLNSIENQIFNNFEIILIYDSDDNKESAYITELIQDFTNLKYINNFSKRGLFYSFYNGIIQSKGQYIITIKPGYSFATNNTLYELDNNINNDIDILEFNLLINEGDYINNNSLNLYRCTHFDSKINLDSYKFNNRYKEIDQEKELIVNKLIKSDIYKNILNKYEHYFNNNNNINNNYYDEIIIFLLRQNKNNFKHINNFGIIEYPSIINSFNSSDTNDKNQLIKDSIFYINFIFDNSYNTVDDKKFVVNEFYNIMNIIYNKYNNFSEEAINLKDKFINCNYISSYKKSNIITYYNGLIN